MTRVLLFLWLLDMVSDIDYRWLVINLIEFVHKGFPKYQKKKYTQKVEKQNWVALRSKPIDLDKNKLDKKKILGKKNLRSKNFAGQ